MPQGLLLPFAAVVAVAAIGGGHAEAGIALAGYKAVYDLALAPGADLPGLANVAGRTVTEFRGSSCAGYMTNVRFVTRTTSDEGKQLVDDVRATSFETPEGYFEFENDIYSGERLSSRAAGTAERGEHETTVKLTDPGERVFDISADAVFPTEQVVRVIEAAIAGENFLAFPLYDGTEEGETVYGTSTVIGAVSTAADDLGAETVVADAGMAGMRHWPVTIGYFKGDSRTEMTPAYTMSLILYENGITRDLKLDYGAYALIGKLTHLEVLPSGACPE